MDPVRGLLRSRWLAADSLRSDLPFGLSFLREDRRCFAYYRFHKRVGKGNWNRYVERYIKPRAIENTQRITFNYRASFQAAKSSASYLWELPKRIAAATSANDVLNAWVHFRQVTAPTLISLLIRHKRKKAYHFVLALRRLCEIKHVDTSDWRFQFIAKKLLKRSKYFIDLPGVCHYLGRLKAVPTLDNLSVLLCEKIERYTPAQLAQIAGAFGNCRLHSKYLFALLARQLEAKIHNASNEDLTTIASAFGRCMVYNFRLFALTSLEMQRRLSPTFKHPDPYRDLTYSPTRHCMAVLQQPITVQLQRPSVHDLLRLVEAFATAKHRDLQLCDLLSQMVRSSLNGGQTADPSDPTVATRVVKAFCTLKVNDVPLFVSILKKVAERPYNYPPSCISDIGKHLAFVLPRQVDSISKGFSECLSELQLHLHRMDPRQLTSTAVFAYKAGASSAWKKDFLDQVNQAIVSYGPSRSQYDAPKLLEVLSMHGSLSTACFNTICRDIYHVVNLFEPVDFQRTSRVLRKLKKSDMTNIKMVNMLSKRAVGQWEEFSDYQYHCVARDLTLAGPPFPSLISDLWSHNRYNKGFRPSLPAPIATEGS
ncbi:uncharacterized protein BcabD6B2_37210 [Babesia caballi]|uniref:RAP domain-containing protein n=1 Tax=Babesia caballi TaxID=5871 RepID=A0AAV4LYQ5_BABCB|nr:hypothetical protein, conserved [Babesia caballi]